MYKLLLTALALGLATGLAAAGDPGHPGPDCPTPPPPCEAQKVQVVYVEQTITAYRTEVRERDVTLTVLNPVVSNVKPVKRCVLAPIWSDEIDVRTIPMPVVRKEVHLVPVCRWESECVTDPHTGCTYTMAHPVTEMKPVTSTHIDTVPFRHESLREVVSMVEKEEDYQPPGVILEYKQEQVKVKQRYLVTVPYQKKIKVPVYVPCTETCPVPERAPQPKPEGSETKPEGGK
jgi:hypothetical protein